MINNNFTINDLGNFAPAFSQVIAKYNLSGRQQLILNSLKQIVLGKLDLADFIDLLMEELQIDFITAGKIVAELKINILDKKSEIEIVVKKWQEKQAQMQVQGFDPQVLLDEILMKAGVEFTDQTLKSRYNKAAISWLKGIRDDTELLDILTRSAKIGGVGLTPEAGDQIIKQLANQKAASERNNQDLAKLISDYETKQSGIGGQVQEAEIDVASKVTAPQRNFQMPVASPELTIDQILAEKVKANASLSPAQNSAPMATPFVEEIEQEERFLDSTEELPSATDLPAAPQQPAVAPKPVAPQSIRPPEIRQPLIRPTEQTSNRPQMSDVKFERKLYGPLDELAAMSLADFRRLSKDPYQSIQKIKGKLDILEGESVLQKNEGIKALKSSPLYKIYAEIMNRALMEGKSFEQAIAERGDINIDEFKAIMELNKSLKY